NPTECLAERPLTGTTLANECGCDLGLLVGMLDRPRLPLDSVIEERLVAGAQHDADMFAHQAPVARLRFDAPAAPKVEASINDLGPAWFERQPTVLSPKMVFEPPAADVDPLFADQNAPVKIEIAEVREG